MELVDAPVSIAKAAEPVAAVRSSPEASIVQAARAVAEDRAQALVSGGSTGAVVAAGVLHLRRARGVHRPALAVPLPSPAGATLLLDVGANVEARAAHLVQFAFLGAAFARSVMGVARPRVALLSNGTEADRGTPLTLEAAGTLRQRGAELDFVGNLEATQLTAGAADVVVTDGFTGNVALKAMEGASQTVIGAVRDAATGSPAGSSRGAAAARGAGIVSRAHRPRAHRRCLPAGAHATGGAAARSLRPGRLRGGDRAGRARRARAGGRAHVRGAGGGGCPASRRVRTGV